jgi:hypothetical protein
VKEQSHKREMAAAVRADFERLRRRGVIPTIDVPESEVAASPRVPAVEEADPIRRPGPSLSPRHSA